MKNEDVKRGMKVVPLRKTAKGWGKLRKSYQWKLAKNAAQPFLQVHYFDDEEQAWVLGFEMGDEETFNGDFFRASDFRLYEPPV
jgi:hypothetical protein